MLYGEGMGFLAVSCEQAIEIDVVVVFYPEIVLRFLCIAYQDRIRHISPVHQGLEVMIVHGAQGAVLVLFDLIGNFESLVGKFLILVVDATIE